MNQKTIQQAIIKSFPIMGSYLFVSMAYGLLMQKSGFCWKWSLFTSLTVYTGAFQFVLVTFLSSGASYATIAITALFMNSRQFFYGLTFVDDFKTMEWKYPYMVHTMTDETYAVNCSMLLDSNKKYEKNKISKKERCNLMFLIALFSRISWMIGAVLGGIIGQVLPCDLKGIDFCMTALFVTIFIDQWKALKQHMPAITGLVSGILLLILVGAKYFLLPALLVVSGIMLAFEKRGTK